MLKLICSRGNKSSDKKMMSLKTRLKVDLIDFITISIGQRISRKVELCVGHGDDHTLLTACTCRSNY